MFDELYMLIYSFEYVKNIGKRIYAALIPAIINPIKLPTAHKNILRSPSRSPETFSALRMQYTVPIEAISEIAEKIIVRIRSSLAITFSFQSIYRKMMLPDYKIFPALALLLVLGVTGCSRGSHSDEVQDRLSRLERVDMKFDARTFSPQERELVKTLIQAGKLVHEAYLHQVYPKGIALRDSIAQYNDERSTNLLRLIIRNGGPFDRMDHFKNFFSNEIKNRGAAFYPPDLTKEEFENYVKAHPEKANALQSPYSVVKRDGKELVAVPFHVEYAAWITPAAELLKKASSLAESASLKKFLASRALALITDDYFQSHVDWIDVVDSDIDLLMAPDEIYDDALLGLKASYEVSVMIRDSIESAKLSVYTKHLNELEQSLPMDSHYKRTITGLSSPMEIVTDVYRGGDIATGYQAVAATLPNDPEVQVKKGTKKIFWKNMMDARVNKIILPIGRELIASDQIQYVTPEGVFNDVLLHELCHAIGPVYVYGKDSLAVNKTLNEHYTAIEEAKADIAGLYVVKFFIDKKIFAPDADRVHYVSALASIFRTIRFGTAEAHGKAAICELNYFLDKGSLRFDPVTKKWSVVFEKMPAAVTVLARELLTLQATGDYSGTTAFFEKWGNTSREVEESLQRLGHLPIDIEPVYIMEWE